MRTLPPRFAEIDYRDEVLSVESAPGASPLALAGCCLGPRRAVSVITGFIDAVTSGEQQLAA
ncbi:hypothetical protein H0264_30530 [Nocardia huaxiensis]|uniref:Uncharacterized protein n=1 Tax=Nocardia huaxiensis TaxID=2755382 RepID=A0A7D6VH45_9NOCA|nr:hypothetical protein [Nocardia huaxiensis]QLY29550.1 hypothetical protein H0264_30530 [Nocardia huaxiensis]